MSPSQSETKAYIPSLDGMRAFAIFIVFFSHSGFGKHIPGGFGVTVFFFISGYLITSLLRKEFEMNGRISLKKFYLRRVLRIWPAFYIVLIVGVVLTLLKILPGEPGLFGFLSQSMHFANYYLIYYGDGLTMGSGVYWSLAVEEHFYLLFPLLYIYLIRYKIKPEKQSLIFYTLCIAILAWRCYLVYWLDSSINRTYYASETRFDSLLFGCALAVYGNPAFDKPKISDIKIKYFWMPIGLALIVFSFFYRNAEFRETFRYSIQGIGLIPVVVVAIRFPEWGMFRILNLRWVRFIGVLSYSIYLVHNTIIQAIEMYLPDIGKLLLTSYSLTLSLVLSYSIYIFIEQPFARLRKRYRVV